VPLFRERIAHSSGKGNLLRLSKKKKKKKKKKRKKGEGKISIQEGNGALCTYKTKKGVPLSASRGEGKVHALKEEACLEKNREIPSDSERGRCDVSFTALGRKRPLSDGENALSWR